MKLLQDEIGLILLRPHGRGITPTEAGFKIYHRAKEFLEHENRLFRLTSTTQTLECRIGTVEIFLLSLISLLNKQTFSNYHLTLLDLSPGKIERLIANHELDFGITYAPFPTKNVEMIEVGKYEFGCYFLKGKFEKKAFSEIPFVVPEQTLSNNPLGIKHRDGWIDSVYSRSKKFKVNLLSTALELTLNGHCAIYIPNFVATKINQSRKNHAKLVEYPLPKKHKNIHRAFLLKHVDRKNDAIFQHLFEIIKTILNPAQS